MNSESLYSHISSEVSIALSQGHVASRAAVGHQLEAVGMENDRDEADGDRTATDTG